MCAECGWRGTSFIKLTTAVCKWMGVVCVVVFVCLFGFTSVSLLCAESRLTARPLTTPRDPFSLFHFLAFRRSCVPLCLLTRGERGKPFTE